MKVKKLPFCYAAMLLTHREKMLALSISAILAACGGIGQNDTVAPVPGGPLNVSNITENSVDLSWNVAADNITPVGNLQYKVVRAATVAAIDTVGEANAVPLSDVVSDWKTAAVSTTAQMLAPNTVYTFAVLVKDEKGNMALYTPQQTTTLAESLPTPSGALFKRVDVAGVTDYVEGTNGVVLTDVNHDGLVDIVGSYTAKTGESKMRMFINQGNMKFIEQPMTILNAKFDTADWGALEIPNMTDINNDGFPDIFITRDKSRNDIGNSLLLSQGNYYTFKDVSASMGIANIGSANHGSSFGDINQDGWIDIGVGAVNVGNLSAGAPNRRMYMFVPNGDNIENGHYINIGEDPSLLPDFGGTFNYDKGIDKSSKGISLVDVDNDGDLDLIQGNELDTNGGDPASDAFAGYYKCGIFTWKNMLKETGELRFERSENNGLASEAQFVRDDANGSYVFTDPNKKAYRFSLVGDPHASSMTYFAMSDIDNDGLLDALVGGPADKWHMQPENVVLKTWKNQGGFSFVENTQALGLETINNTYSYWWSTLFETPVQPNANYANRQLYSRGAVFGDFNNDGLEDMVVLDSREDPAYTAQFRNILMLNNGDGTFRALTESESGFDTNGITGVAADINNDGLLDFYSASDPHNSSSIPDSQIADDRFKDHIYLNTGSFGGAKNHWLEVSFSGISDANLTGANLFVYAGGTLHNPDAKLLGMKQISTNNHVKSSRGLTAHFGLGEKALVDLKLVLPSGKVITLENQAVNRQLTMPIP